MACMFGGMIESYVAIAAALHMAIAHAKIRLAYLEVTAREVSEMPAACGYARGSCTSRIQARRGWAYSVSNGTRLGPPVAVYGS